LQKEKRSDWWFLLLRRVKSALPDKGSKSGNHNLEEEGKNPKKKSTFIREGKEIYATSGAMLERKKNRLVSAGKRGSFYFLPAKKAI